MDKLNSIIEYLKTSDITWKEPYVKLLTILQSSNQNIEHEVLNQLVNNMQNLIMRDKFEESCGRTWAGSRLLEYNDFVEEVAKVLNTNTDKKYLFLLFPQITEDTGTMYIYRGKIDNFNTHVFKMELSENLMEKEKVMFVVLCHELAHYVGTELRSRDKRLEKIYEIYSRLLVLGMRSYLEKVSDNKQYVFRDNEAWNSIEIQLSKWIKLYYERELKKEYIEVKDVYLQDEHEKVVKYNEDNMGHMFYIEPTILEAICDMLKYKSMVIFEPIVNSKYVGKDYLVIKELLQKCIEKITMLVHEDNGEYAIGNSAVYVKYILKESYADLISILGLRLSCEQYINCIMSQYPDVNVEEYSNKIIARIALVVYTMCYRDENSLLSFGWSDDDLDIKSDKNIELNKLLDIVYQFIVASFNSDFFQEESHLRNLSDNVYLVLQDKKVIECIFEYLWTCRQTFEKSFDVKFEKVREKYNNFK